MGPSAEERKSSFAWVRKALSSPYAAPLSLLIIIMFLFKDAVTGKACIFPLTVEFFSQWHPYRLFAMSTWGRQLFPLWSHNLMMGFPLAAFPHAGSYYPLEFFFYLLDYGSASTWFFFVNLGGCMLLTYGLLRETGASRLTSWLMAVSYGLSGPTFHAMAYPQDFSTNVWLPGLLWLMLRMLRRNRIIDLWGLAGLYALAYLSRGIENLLFASLIFIVYIFVTYGPQRKRLVVAGLSFALGLAIAAPQLCLTLTYLGQSLRFHQHETGAATLWENLHIVAGLFIFWTPWTKYFGIFYLGPLIPLGVILSPRDPRLRRVRRVALIIFAVSLAFVINLWPFSHLFDHLPIIGSMNSVRFRVIPSLFLLAAIIAARTFDELLEAPEKLSSQRAGWLAALFIATQCGCIILGPNQVLASSRLVFGMTIIIGVLTAFIIWLMRRSRGKELTKENAALQAWLLVLAAAGMIVPAYMKAPLFRGPLELLNPPLSLPGSRTSLVPGRFHVVSPYWMLFHADPEKDNYAYAVSWNLLRLDKGPGSLIGVIRNGLFRPASLQRRMGSDHFRAMDYKIVSPANQPILNFLAVDYLAAEWVPIWSMDPMPIGSDLVRSKYSISGQYLGPTPPRQDGKFLLAPASEWRIFLDLEKGDYLQWDRGRDFPNPHMSIGLTGTRDHEPAFSVPDLDIDRDESSQRCLLPIRSSGAYELSIKINDGAAESIALTGARITNPARTYQLVADGQFRLYRNRRSLPLYGIYTEVKIIPEEQLLDALFNPALFNPEQWLLISPDQADPTFNPNRPRQRRPDDVQVLKFENDRVELRTVTNAPAYLSIAESYYPSWRVWVDGKQTRIARANYAFQAVPLPQPGTHIIRLENRPPEFKLGLMVAFSTLGTALIMFPLSRFLFRKQMAPSP